jgi:hypothetical protein
LANRQVFPSSLFPLRGDISAEAGSTTVIVQGLQGIPIIAPPVEPAGLDTLFYDSYNNDWYYASPWDIPVGIPLVWEGYGYGSSGISWIAPDTLAFGNGTDGDVSGAAAMTALVLFGSASYYGPYGDYDVDYGPSYDQFYTSIFSGATQNWNLVLPPSPGSNGQVLTTNGTGVTAWTTVSGGGGTSPGGVPTNIQFNNSGVFGGIPGSSVDGTNGLVALAPTGTGVALSVTGDAAGDYIQDWFVNGSSTPGAVVFPTGLDAVSIAWALEDAAGDIILINPVVGYGIEYVDVAGNYTQVGRGTSAGTLNIFNKTSGGNAGQAALIVTGDASLHDVAQFCINSTGGASPSVSIDSSGTLHVFNSLADSTGSIGTSGQVLSSTVSGVEWVAASSGGSPGGSNGDIQYNNAGAFGGSASTISAGGTITLPTTQAIIWGTDTSISRISGGLIAIGSGSVGSETGGIILNTINLGDEFYDNTDYAGANGWVLSSTGTKTLWINPATSLAVPGSTGDILYNNGGVMGASLATITSTGSITLPDTQVIKWTGAAYSGVGLSQLAADTLAVGNGSDSDVSGAMAMTGLILFGSSYYSAYDAFHTTIYSGATKNWNLVLPETAGANGQFLFDIGSGFTEWHTFATTDLPALTPSVGQGFWAGYGIFGNLPVSALAASAVPGIAAANSMACWTIYVPFPIVVKKITMSVAVAGAAGSVVDVGLYPATAGSTILFGTNGGVNGASATTQTVGLYTWNGSAYIAAPSVVIPAGWYYFAYTASTVTTMTIYTVLQNTNAIVEDILNNQQAAGARIFGLATSAATAGVLPAALPTLSNTLTNNNMPAVWISG